MRRRPLSRQSSRALQKSTTTAFNSAEQTFVSPEVRNFFACCALHACLSPDDALGAGSHPGSGVTMAPGRNAATMICADLGLALPG
jgi:hypothetical protein